MGSLEGRSLVQLGAAVGPVRIRAHLPGTAELQSARRQLLDNAEHHFDGGRNAAREGRVLSLEPRFDPDWLLVSSAHAGVERCGVAGGCEKKKRAALLGP